jgi:hypothetical protein
MNQTFENIKKTLEDFIQRTNLIVVEDTSNELAKGTSYYKKDEHKVCIPSIQKTLENLDKNVNVNNFYFLSTIVHELAHSTLKTLKRNLPYAEEEVVAETTACLFTKQVVLNTVTSDKAHKILEIMNISYLSCWWNNAKQDLEEPSTNTKYNELEAMARQALKLIQGGN